MKVTDSIELLNIDCDEYMKGCSEYKFDLAIVDPPYGIGDNWSKSRQDRFYKQGKLHSYQNKERPSKEYFQQLKRISKNQIIWGGNYYADLLEPHNHWIVWDKNRDCEKTFMSECELAWHSFSSPARMYRHQWDGFKKGNETKNGIKIHPHQKPINLYKWCLGKFAEEGNSIFDSHLGSGSIAIACHQEGFNLVGCELDKEYYEASIKRFKAVTSQKQLF